MDDDNLHALDDFTDSDGWDVTVCDCGWLSPPCPDKITAVNFWGQHLLEARGAST